MYYQMGSQHSNGRKNTFTHETIRKDATPLIKKERRAIWVRERNRGRFVHVEGDDIDISTFLWRVKGPRHFGETKIQSDPGAIRANLPARACSFNQHSEGDDEVFQGEAIVPRESLLKPRRGLKRPLLNIPNPYKRRVTVKLR